MEKVSEYEIGWLSGIIDGEGNFTIRILKHKTKYFGIRIRVQPQFTLTNTSKAMIDKFAEILDKLEVKYSLRIRDRRKKRPNTKPQYVIEVYSRQLKKLLPHLKCIAKAEEVEIMKEVIEFQEKKRHGKWGRHFYFTAEDLEYLYSLRNRLVELHGRQAKKLVKIDPREFDIPEEARVLLERKIGLQMHLNRKNLTEEARKKIEQKLMKIEERLKELV